MFTENLKEFFDEKNGFAVRVLFKTAAGSSRTIVGIFEEGFHASEFGRMSLETTDPRFVCQTSQANGIERGDIATANRREYDVLSVHPDGTGVSVVNLAPR